MNAVPSQQLIDELVKISGKDNVVVGKGVQEYALDMADFEGMPLAVVKPKRESEIMEVVEFAKRYRMPIVPRGAGSSLTGASVLAGALVLDMRGMNRILKVDTVNWLVQVEPGLALDDLNEQLKGYGFFFPPDPASSYICTVGGSVAEGSGGLRCIKYGTMKDWVVALRVVLANGAVVNLGEPLAKNRAGYDLVHLFVGSEGTLGIITQATLKIIPLSDVKTRRFLINFDDWASVTEVIRELRSSWITPHMFEFLDRESIIAVRQLLNMDFHESEATLLVDVGVDDAAKAVEIFRRCGATRLGEPKDAEEAENFYQMRAMAYMAIKSTASGTQTEDTVVPVDRLGEYLGKVKEISRKYGLKIPVAGHAGDGNVHPVILYEKADPVDRKNAASAFEELCRCAIQMGGSVTGEHGIGSQKSGLLREQLTSHGGEEALRLMKEIKRIFDPESMMNPGKYVEAA